MTCLSSSGKINKIANAKEITITIVAAYTTAMIFMEGYRLHYEPKNDQQGMLKLLNCLWSFHSYDFYFSYGNQRGGCVKQ
jgi:hypothetical protein